MTINMNAMIKILEGNVKHKYKTVISKFNSLSLNKVTFRTTRGHRERFGTRQFFRPELSSSSCSASGPHRSPHSRISP